MRGAWRPFLIAQVSLLGFGLGLLFVCFATLCFATLCHALLCHTASWLSRRLLLYQDGDGQACLGGSGFR
jgi:hypothetical protein